MLVNIVTLWRRRILRITFVVGCFNISVFIVYYAIIFMTHITKFIVKLTIGVSKTKHDLLSTVKKFFQI